MIHWMIRVTLAVEISYGETKLPKKPNEKNKFCKNNKKIYLKAKKEFRNITLL